MTKEEPSMAMSEGTQALPRRGAFSGIQGYLIGLILLALIPVLLSHVYFSYDRYRQRKGDLIQANLDIARVVAKNFETFIESVLRSERVAGLAFASRQPIADEDRDHLLDAFQGANPEVRSLFWVSPKGLIIASSLRSYVGFDISDRSFYRDIVAGKDWGVSELITGKATGKPAFTISCGIRNEKGELLGIVAASIEPDRLDSVVGVNRSEGGGTSIVDNKGMLIYRYPPIQPTWEERNWLRLYPSLFQEALSGKEAVKTVFATYDRKMRIAAVTPIPSVGWVASAGQWEREALWPVVLDTLESGGVVLLIALASSFLAFALSRKISASINVLRNHAFDLGRGGAESPVTASGPAELKDLADALNKMAEEMRSREEALRLSEEKFATAFANNPAAVQMSRLEDGQLLDVNHTWVALSGYSREEAIGHSARKMRIWPTPEAAARFVRELREKGSLHGWEQEFFRKSGDVYLAELSAQVLTVRGEKLILSTFVDITSRKQMEKELSRSRDELDLRVRERTAELEKANTELGRYNTRLVALNKELQDFAFIASHDLQEPLRKVVTFGNLLAERCGASLDETSRDYLGRMQNAAMRMRNLLGSLLEYSRVTTRVKPMEETEIRKCVEEALSNLEVLAKEKNARVQVGDLPKVGADPVQMTELFQNLIGNALKFHRQGEVPCVKVYARLRDEQGVHEIRVEDNGIGFEEKYVDQIFLPFQRLHGRSSVYEGVGMGLAICKKIVEHHGGEITATSEWGKGSTFIVRLPAERKV